LVALKIQKSAQHYTEAAEDEIKLLSSARSKDPGGQKFVVKLLDSFSLQGPHGRRTGIARKIVALSTSVFPFTPCFRMFSCLSPDICMVFEVLGESSLRWIQRYHYRGLPFSLVQTMARHALTGLAFLHDECGIIHTDLKPENLILLRHNPCALSPAWGSHQLASCSFLVDCSIFLRFRFSCQSIWPKFGASERPS
jgi:serine/threonine-protein kinase SRPK3